MPRDRDAGLEDDRDDLARVALPVKSRKTLAALVLGLASIVCLLNILAGIPAVIFGSLALREIGDKKQRLGGWGLALTGILTGILGIILAPILGMGLLGWAVWKVDDLDAVGRSRRNLGKMGRGLRDYHDASGGFPHGGAIRSVQGKPLLSWRVAILPYLGEMSLYSEFRLGEPWNSPTNKRLLARMPKVFRHPMLENSVPEGHTVYRGFVGPGTVFDPTTPRAVRLVDVTDGAADTLLVVEAAESIEWTRPDDIPYLPSRPVPRLGRYFPDGTNTVLADGKVWIVPHNTPEGTVRAMITRNGGEIFMKP